MIAILFWSTTWGYLPQHNYYSNGQYQYQGVSNQLISVQHGENGDDGGEKNRINKNPTEILTTYPEMIVEKKFTMRETVNDLHRKNSKKM